MRLALVPFCIPSKHIHQAGLNTRHWQLLFHQDTDECKRCPVMGGPHSKINKYHKTKLCSSKCLTEYVLSAYTILIKDN